MEVEHVAGERFAARRAAQQQRDRAVGIGLLGQVVEHDQHVLAVVHPVLTDGRAGVGGKPFEAGGVRRGCGDDGRVLHRAALFEGPLHRSDRGALLADRDVDAAHLLLGIAGLPVLALVEDGVDADGGLAGLAVTDDQLPLATTDRGHRVDGLDTGLQRLADALSLHHGGGLQLQRAALAGLDVTLPVDRLTEGVDDAAEECVADRHRQHLAGALDLLALLDLAELTEDHGADAVLVEVQCDAEDAAGELEQLLGHHRGQTLDVGDAVTGVDDGADLFAIGIRGEGGDVVLDRALDVSSRDSQLCHGFSLPAFWCSRGSVSSVSRAAGSRPTPAARTATRR